MQINISKAIGIGQSDLTPSIEQTIREIALLKGIDRIARAGPQSGWPQSAVTAFAKVAKVTITAANADKAQTVMNAGQKAMWAYRDWLRCPSAELRARAERNRDLYEMHRRELING